MGLTDDTEQLHGQPSNSAWFEGARDGPQLYDFLDSVVGSATQWYLEYECRGFANEPQGRAVVRVVAEHKASRAVSGGFFCEGFHMAASDDCYSQWADFSLGREDCIYHLCQGHPERCKSDKPGRTVVHIGVWRRISLKGILDSEYCREAGQLEFSRRFATYFHPKLLGVFVVPQLIQVVTVARGWTELCLVPSQIRQWLVLPWAAFAPRLLKLRGQLGPKYR